MRNFDEAPFLAQGHSPFWEITPHKALRGLWCPVPLFNLCPPETCHTRLRRCLGHREVAGSSKGPNVASPSTSAIAESGLAFQLHAQRSAGRTPAGSGMSPSLPAVAPSLARFFGRSDRTPSGPVADLNALLDRIRKRLYRETVPVLASWWLKTVYSAGHNRVWWSELDVEIAKALRNQFLDVTAVEAMTDIQTWVRQTVLPRQKAPPVQPLLARPFRPDMTADQAAPYLSRLLNEWLPGEVARLLNTEDEFGGSDEGGVSALAIAKALDRLLLRERFSPATLELLLEAESLSPKCAYPADIEIFRDIVLALLGRTTAPAPPVLPATVLAGGFADAVGRALLVSSENGEELHLPLDEAEALEVFKHDPARIGSIVVTMDGRWWQSTRLQSGPETVIVYRPGERLRIDFTAEHVRLVLPWPAAETRWQGDVQLPDHVALFGRDWRGRAWERNADRTWLHLEFSGVLTLAEALDSENPRPRGLRPASMEMAWSEVEQALATGVSDSIDQLHREDLVPLARSLERMVDCLLRSRPPSREDVERSVRSVRYMHGGIADVYGRIPWRVLPARARTALLKRRGEAALTDLFAETFDDAPPAARTSPPRAA